MSGIPVVISDSGNGIPVTPVASGAPVMTVSQNGFGTPIVITDIGAPFIVEGAAPQWSISSVEILGQDY